MAKNPPFKKKSGDSKLADAQVAREKERTKHVELSKDPQEYAQHLVKEVEDAAEKKRASGDAAGADKTEAALSKLVQVIEQMEKRVISLESKTQATNFLSKALPPQLKCPTCRQVIMVNGRGVCDGTHIPLFVAPSLMELWREFQGATINGVIYGGRCLVPPVLADTIKVEVSRWERGERRKFMPGGKVFGENELKYNTGQVEVGRTPIIDA